MSYNHRATKTVADETDFTDYYVRLENYFPS